MSFKFLSLFIFCSKSYGVIYVYVPFPWALDLLIINKSRKANKNQELYLTQRNRGSLKEKNLKLKKHRKGKR